MKSLEIGAMFFIENQNVTWEGKEPMRRRSHHAVGGGRGGGTPLPPL